MPNTCSSMNFEHEHVVGNVLQIMGIKCTDNKEMNASRARLERDWHSSNTSLSTTINLGMEPGSLASSACHLN